MFYSQSFPIVENSQVGAARRFATHIASKIGFDESEVGKVAIIVTELGTNLLKHTNEIGGEIIIQGTFVKNTTGFLEVISLDKGPGMENVSFSMRDGNSTTGTRGEGLGGIQRLSDDFDIYSKPNQGTSIYSRIGKGTSEDTFKASAICLPMTGEEVSGDKFALNLDSNRFLYMVCDGLGHGVMAHEAAREAVNVFQNRNIETIPRIIETLHESLRKTRGAAISILEVFKDKPVINYVGVGNIAAVVIGNEKSHHMVSLSGIVGHEIRKIQTFQYPLERDSVIVMHSDGISAKFDLSKYPGIMQRHPSIIASIIYRDYGRKKDDSTVMVIKRAV